MSGNIVIVGGGPAGLEIASSLGSAARRILILEKSGHTGGKLRRWHHLFPKHTNASEVLHQLEKPLGLNNTEVRLNSEVTEIKPQNGQFALILKNGENIDAEVVVLATGYELFDAARKEEYGYGIYPNVITSADLEDLLSHSSLPSALLDGTPKKIAFVHCVGSRDKKSGNISCSKLCCVTGVKQAIELSRRLPGSRVYNFYMDLRMYGQHFEEMYLQAQEEYKVNFIRGRVSEIAEIQGGRLQLKAEDTLSGRPVKTVFDLVVLLVGMVPPAGASTLAKSMGLPLTPSGFLEPVSGYIHANETIQPGVFLAGSCREPLSLQESVTDARAASLKITEWLKMKEKR